MTTSTRSTLGSTELEDAGSPCERLFWLKHIVHLITKEARRGRTLGTILHVSLKYWYAQFLLGGPPAWFYVEDRASAVAKAGNGEPEWIKEAEAIFAAYVTKYGVTDRSWRFLSIETEYGITVDEIVYWAGPTLSVEATRALATLDRSTVVTIRPDLMVEDPNGTQFMPDYKSTLGKYNKLPRWHRANSWSLAWQPMYYLWVARHVRGTDGNLLFPRLRSFIVQRILNVEPYTSDRHEIEMTASAYAHVPSQILVRLARRKKLIDKAASGESLDPSYGTLCHGVYGSCDFANLCRAEDSDKANVLAEHYVVE